MTDYADRVAGPQGEFATEADNQSAREVANLIEARTGAKLYAFAPFAPIDYFAVKDRDVRGFVEVKTRSHAVGTYPTVFLNMRKWWQLLQWHVCTGLKVSYVVRFTDGIRWIRIQDVDARRVQLGGCNGYVKSRLDIEPVILVPLEDMTVLE